MNKQLAAQKIRACLEGRIARILECQPSELPCMKLGTLVHFAFLLKGHLEELGGFSTTMSGMLQILGNDIVWEEPRVEEVETPKLVVN